MSKKIYILLSLAVLLFTACDSGDIYPKDDGENESFVTAEFLLSGLNTYPQSYLLIFGAFADDNMPISSTTLTKPKEGESVKVSLSNISEEATHVRLCLSTLGRQTIYTFFEQEIQSDQDNTIDIPLTEINLLQYGRIQQQVFELGTCASCHGTTSGAAGLKLGKGVSYADLVNKESRKSDKLRVAPNDIAQSFLIDVLTDSDVELSQPHTTILSKKEDVELLKAWIENGATDE